MHKVKQIGAMETREAEEEAEAEKARVREKKIKKNRKSDAQGK